MCLYMKMQFFYGKLFYDLIEGLVNLFKYVVLKFVFIFDQCVFLKLIYYLYDLKLSLCIKSFKVYIKVLFNIMKVYFQKFYVFIYCLNKIFG